nr:ATP-binding protein [uncultured Carboxylicivirga sp.]
MKNKFENINALRISAYFAIIGLAWIYGSDYLVDLIQANVGHYRLLQTIKGSFFVISVSCIIYFLVLQLLIKLRNKHQVVVASEERLRKTLDCLIEGCQIIDFNWRYVYLNSVSAKHGKKSIEEMSGKLITEVYPGIEKTEMFTHLKNCMDNRVQFKMQNKFLYSDGSYAWFELSIQPVPEGIYVLSYDITKRKKAQLALHESNEHLIEAQRIAKLGDFVWNCNTGKVRWSKALYELLGYDDTDLVNIDFFNSEIHHPDDLSKIVNWFNNAIVSKHNKLVPLEYRIFKKDRSVIYVRTSGIIDFGNNESPIVFATMQDITDKKLAEIELQNKNEELNASLREIEKINKELKRAIEKAETSDRLKSVFLANMSHEIRTPLNGLTGFSDIILSTDNLSDEERKSYTRIIRNCSDELLQIVNDILDISALESGNLNLKINQFEIGNLLDDLSIIYKGKTATIDKEIDLVLYNSHRQIYLKTDEGRLRQIFINLLDNATKFTPRGTIEFGIELINENSIVFFVRDTGIGIPKQFHELIFDRFRQVENAKNKVYGGNGLGLSIVKQLLNLLQGEIWLDSEEDKGAIFYFKIPINISAN